MKHSYFIGAELGRNSRNPTTVEMEKTLYLLSVISCHVTLQRRNLWILPLKSTTVSDTFMTGPVCVDADARRIVSDRRRAQMAVSHDVLNFFNMWQGGFLPLWERLISPHRGQDPLTQNPAVVGQLSTRMRLKTGPTAAASADEHGGPWMAFSKAAAEKKAQGGGANDHRQRCPILPLTPSLCPPPVWNWLRETWNLHQIGQTRRGEKELTRVVINLSLHLLIHLLIWCLRRGLTPLFLKAEAN